MNKRTAFVAATVIGLTALVGPTIGFAQTDSPQTDSPQPQSASPSVQLNADTVGTKGLVNKYVNENVNVALGQCTVPGTRDAPESTTFASPVLTFAHYAYQPTMGVTANVTADALLKPGTGPGTYQLTMNCGGKSYAATFTVSAPAKEQVRQVPVGAAHAGGGGTAR